MIKVSSGNGRKAEVFGILRFHSTQRQHRHKGHKIRIRAIRGRTPCTFSYFNQSDISNGRKREVRKLAKKLTDEMKAFISTKMTEEEKSGSETIREFGDSYGFLPSLRTINKYKNFNETVDTGDDTDEGGDEGDVDAETKDTRSQTELIDFSGSEIDEQDFERLCRNVNKSKSEVFELLKEAASRGYTKVDIATGEIEK